MLVLTLAAVLLTRRKVQSKKLEAYPVSVISEYLNMVQLVTVTLIYSSKFKRRNKKSDLSRIILADSVH